MVITPDFDSGNIGSIPINPTKITFYHSTNNNLQ